jgi:hypothetical protein
MTCGDRAGLAMSRQSQATISRDAPTESRRGALSPCDHEGQAMRNRMIMAAVLLSVTVLGGCVAYPGYGYGNAYPQYGYGYGSRYYAAYPGSYAYQYPPVYTSDYNGYANTYRTNNGGNR